MLAYLHDGANIRQCYNKNINTWLEHPIVNNRTKVYKLQLPTNINTNLYIEHDATTFTAHNTIIHLRTYIYLPDTEGISWWKTENLPINISFRGSIKLTAHSHLYIQIQHIQSSHSLHFTTTPIHSSDHLSYTAGIWWILRLLIPNLFRISGEANIAKYCQLIVFHSDFLRVYRREENGSTWRSCWGYTCLDLGEYSWMNRKCIWGKFGSIRMCNSNGNYRDIYSPRGRGFVLFLYVECGV